MNKIFSSTAAALVLMSTSLIAQAADLPQKAYAPPPVMMAVYDWTGFYVGGNAGYGSSRNCWGSVPVGGAVIPDGCNSSPGGVVGGQVGYRWQMGQVVFGLEGQGDWASLRDFHVSIFDPTLTDRVKVSQFRSFYRPDRLCLGTRRCCNVKGGAAVTGNTNRSVQATV